MCHFLAKQYLMTVPVFPAGTSRRCGGTTTVPFFGETVPITVPVFPAGTYRHCGGTTTVPFCGEMECYNRGSTFWVVVMV